MGCSPTAHRDISYKLPVTVLATNLMFSAHTRATFPRRLWVSTAVASPSSSHSSLPLSASHRVRSRPLQVSPHQHAQMALRSKPLPWVVIGCPVLSGTGQTNHWQRPLYGNAAPGCQGDKSINGAQLNSRSCLNKSHYYLIVFILGSAGWAALSVDVRAAAS